MFTSGEKDVNSKSNPVVFGTEQTPSCIVIVYIPLTLYPRRGSRGIRYSFETATIYQKYLAMSNTADVTDGKPIAI
jgi:hypothetical protein